MLMTNKKESKDDDYQTPKETWKSIQQYIPKDKVVWECFYGDGNSGKYLQDLGFKVIHQKEDFFQHNKGDIIVTNPPFSQKQKILQRLKELNKPFVLIMPASVLGTKMLSSLFPDIQIIIPKGRINFIKNGKETKGCWFASFFYCWKMDLPKDLIFLE